MVSQYMKKAITFLEKAHIGISGIWVDCGCGKGVYSHALVMLGADLVLAIDTAIKQKFSSLNENVLPIKGNCKNIPVKNKIASGLAYVNVLHFYQNPYQMIKEAHRVLKSSGYIVIIEYKKQIPTSWNPHPLHTDEIIHLLRMYEFTIFETTLVDIGYRPKQLVVAFK